MAMQANKVTAAVLEVELRSQERRLWGICYRMTGSAADADELVQETFTRALANPPRIDGPLEAWLTRVAMNLSRDLLRKRKRTPYPGPWLPAPIETGDEASGAELPADPSSEARYDLLESVTFAFLLALEALSPAQRAVLILRDVFDYSVQEVADALGLSEANVRTTHFRARKAMAAYDSARTVPTRAMQERHRAALEGLVSALLSRDVAGVERLLGVGVCHRSDGGGDFAAARVTVRGARKVAAFLLRLLEMRGPPDEVEVRAINGFPAAVVRYHQTPRANEAPVFAPVFVVQLDVGTDGRIVELYSVLATRKLSALA